MPNMIYTYHGRRGTKKRRHAFRSIGRLARQHYSHSKGQHGRAPGVISSSRSSHHGALLALAGGWRMVVEQQAELGTGRTTVAQTCTTNDLSKMLLSRLLKLNSTK